MKSHIFRIWSGTGLVAALVLAVAPIWAANGKDGSGLDFQLPNEKWQLPFKDDQPIYFVTRTSNVKEWNSLPRFWNEVTETVLDPRTQEKVTRKAVKIKVPLGLNKAPTVPVENPMTVARWALGKQLYFDPVLSSDGTISCSSCHNPRRGWTDQSAVSIGIFGQKGGVSAPTVLNTGFNLRQFWDGRAASLEDQSQGPPQNPIEMWDGKGHAWNLVIQRIRAKGDYTARFKAAFGTEPTRDAVAKAIATFERTVLSGNSIHDRADLAARIRAAEEGSTDVTPKAEDYAGVLKDAFARKDTNALQALGLDAETGLARVGAVGKQLANGRNLFFGKARCSLCHTGDNFTDDGFHNLGVGVKDGKIPPGSEGRLASQPTGHKDPTMMGAFKTPTLRALVTSAPYMHDGSEKTLEQVIDLYDRGGNHNRWLSTKLRDAEAEKAYILAKRSGAEYRGPQAFVFPPDDHVVVPLKLNLTAEEKADLVLFLRALQGDPVDPIVADPDYALPSASAKKD